MPKLHKPKLHIMCKDGSGKDIIFKRSDIKEVLRDYMGITTIIHNDRTQRRISGKVATFFKLLLIVLMLSIPCSAGFSSAQTIIIGDRDDDSTSTTIVTEDKVIFCTESETGIVYCQEL